MSFDGGAFPLISNNNTLILGGSFNPIHHGHLICARAAAESLGLQTVRLIPAGTPPLKAVSSDFAPGRHRLGMCLAAVVAMARATPDRSANGVGLLHFEVSDIEVVAEGLSYTLTTARALRAQGMAQINWLIGADQLHALPRWHEPEALLDEVNFIVMGRPGYSLNWSALPSYMQKLEKNWVQTPHMDISATNIRRRLAADLSIDWLTPPAVVEYILKHGLYRSGPVS